MKITLQFFEVRTVTVFSVGFPFRTGIRILFITNIVF